LNVPADGILKDNKQNLLSGLAWYSNVANRSGFPVPFDYQTNCLGPLLKMLTYVFVVSFVNFLV
jgi:hypothetical protein